MNDGSAQGLWGQFRGSPAEIKSAQLHNGSGIIKGWATVWDVTDYDGERISPEAFGNIGGTVKLLLGHDPNKPIGHIHVIEPRERGLWVEARLLKDRYRDAAEAWDMVGDKLLDGFSVGFVPKARRQEQDGTYTITQAELLEISLVSLPCNPAARVTEIKSVKATTEREEHTHMELNELKTRIEEKTAEMEAKTADLTAKSEALSTKNAELETKTAQMEQQLADLSLKVMNPKKAEPAPTAAEVDAGDFWAFIRKGYRGIATKDSKIITTRDNQVLIPEVISDKVVELAGDSAIMRGCCSTMFVDSPNFAIPVIKNGALSGWRTKEEEYANVQSGVDVTQVKPVFGVADALIDLSDILLADSRFDLERMFVDHAGRKLAVDEDMAFTKGTGTLQPKGLFTYPVAEQNDKTRPFGTIECVKLKVGKAFTAETLLNALYSMIGSLNQVYRAGAKFMMNNKTKTAILTLFAKDGRPLWQPSLSAEVPDMLLGYPVIINDFVDDMEADKNFLAFGDFSAAYQIAVIPPTEIVRKPLDGPVVRLVVTERAGGCLKDSQAVKFLQGAAGA